MKALPFLLIILSAYAQVPTVAVSGGGGASPAGSDGDIQIKSGSGFASSSTSIDRASLSYPVAVVQGGDASALDLTASGSYTDGIANPAAVFEVQITNSAVPDKFKWRKNAGSYTTNVSITGAAQLLSDGVSVTFGLTSGHDVGDTWLIYTANNTTSGGGAVFVGPVLVGINQQNTDGASANYNGALTYGIGVAGIHGRANLVVSDTSTTIYGMVGQQIFTNYNPSANTGSDAVALSLMTATDPASTHNVGTMYGTYNALRHFGSGTVSTVWGEKLEIGSWSSGTHPITNLYGIGVNLYGSATSSTATGIAVYAPSGSYDNDAIGLKFGNWSSAAIAGAGPRHSIASDGGTALFKTGADATVGLQLQANASQSADLLQALASDGTTVLAKIASNGSISSAAGGLASGVACWMADAKQLGHCTNAPSGTPPTCTCSQ